MKQLSRYCMLAALASVVGLGALVPLPTGAKASLIGDTVDCDMQPNNIWSCNQASAVVAAGGPEFTLDLNQTTRFHVDVGVSSVLLTWVAAGGFTLGASDVFTLSSLDWVDNPTGKLDDFGLTTTLGGINAADITLNDHSLSIFLAGVIYNTGDLIQLDLITDHPIPEPSTLLLLGSGLAGLGFFRRRRKRKA